MPAELSFGCASYLIKRPEGNILVDVPRYVPKLVNRIKVCLQMLLNMKAARLSAFIGDLQKALLVFKIELWYIEHSSVQAPEVLHGFWHAHTTRCVLAGAGRREIYLPHAQG